MKPKVFLIIFLCSLFAETAFGKDFFVSPHGDDTHPGTEQDPFGTVYGAKKAVRNYRKESPEDRTIRIIFMSGTYYMDSPLELGPVDGGDTTVTVKYMAAPGEKVVFSGGKKLSGFERVKDNLWKTHISEVSLYKWHFEQLYVNGNRAVRARTPNLGSFFQVDEVKETVLVKGSGRAPEFGVQQVFADKESLSGLQLQQEKELGDVLLVFYHNWDNTRKFVEAYEEETGSLYISGQGMKPWNPLNKNSRFFVENIRSGLDVPGEWFLEKDGTLFYMAREDEDMTTAEVVVPVTDQFLIISGKKQARVQNIYFEGISFQVAGYITPKGGNEPAQAAAPIPSVIMVDYAENIHFVDCEVAHTGIGAIWMRAGVEDSSIQRCYLHDLGAGGVKIGPFAAGSKEGLENDVSRRILVDNNIIRSGGWVFPCAVGATIFHASDNQLTHNEIADFRYSGVSVGWVWGYTPSFAKRNTIKYNHIHHLGWGDLSDMGGVYTLGLSEGTEVSNNVIHHVYSLTYGGWGLYTDEGSTGVLMENNLVYACKSSGFHQHYGKDNHIRNNIFAYNIKAQLQATRVEEHNSFFFTNNIVLFDKGSLLSSNWAKINFTTDQNLYWDERTTEIKFDQLSFKEWQALGKDKKSIVSNPYFKDAKNADFSFLRSSAYRKIGFKPFKTDNVGVYGDESWIKLAQFDPELAAKFDEIVIVNEGF
ncbi:right-handed parallel beta-helix repeat-containing protein [Lunatibacter salilacus]|uniref:right-handed parallel beta-helix repeat-containing protein n=1 Tax=Lunatibacter salilacus TaxID=2483804 RepID=UPI00131CEA72|nr:right-handed parallel beta-helix repeat-containing protein [Lunatibacter salilacus]